MKFSTLGPWPLFSSQALLDLRHAHAFFSLVIVIALFVSEGCGHASTLVAGFATTNPRPNFGMYKPSETIPITFGATGASGQTLTVKTYDIEGTLVAGPTTYSVTSSSWSTTVNAYNAKLGFYRIYASLTNGTQINSSFVSGATTPQLFASAVPSGAVYPGGPPWSSFAGPLPGGFISYAVVPDPTTRVASIPETHAFFGMQASGGGSNDELAFLGVRWVLDGGWCWNQMQPNQNQETTFIANPAAMDTWATNGNGSTPWTVYSIPNLTKDGAPYTGAGGIPWSSYPGTPNVFKGGTFIYNTGALSSSYYTDWNNFATHVAQQWPAVYPSRTQKLYEVTWEPVIPWGYGGYDPNTGALNSSETAGQLEADLATMYSLAHTAMHAADSNAKIMGPCVDVDNPNSLGLDYAYLDAGLKTSLDAFSAHPYMENDAGWTAFGMYEPEMAGQPANIDTMKRHLQNNYGLNIPMIGTEQGWRTRQSIGTAPSQTTPTPANANEINQARRMVRANLIMLGEGWQMNTAFTYNDYPTNDNLNQMSYWDWGLFYNLDPVSYGGYGPSKVMPKPVAASYAAMTYVVENRKSVNNVNWLGDTIRGYVYESYTTSTDDVLALWDFSGATTNITINTGVASVTEYDWLGNSSTVATSSGNLTVTVKNGEPIYIKGVASSIWGSARTATNIALNKSVTTSGNSSASTPGSLAVDGDVWSFESEWMSTNDTSSKWLAINLGGSYSINEIRFFTGSYDISSGYGSDFNPYRNPLPSYHLQQWNGSTWVDIVNRTTNSKAVIDEVFSPVTTTQVRLLVDAQSSAFQAKLYEIQVFGTAVGGSAPVITSQPVSENCNVGGQIAFQVAATGGTLSYQWYHNGTAMPGQTIYIFYKYPAAISDAGSYYCVVSNSSGSTNTNTVALTVGGSSNGVDEEVIGATSGSSTHIDAVVEGTDNGLYYQSWNGSAWSGWSSLSTSVVSGPALTNWGSTRFDFFYTGTDGSVRHRADISGTFTAEESRGGSIVGGPGATAWSSSRMDIFGRGTDNGLWWQIFNGSSWGSWTEISGSNMGSAPSATNWGVNRLDVFYSGGGDSSLRHRWYTGTWSGEESLGGILIGGPTAVAWASNRIDVFVRGTDNGLWWQKWNGSAWSGWSEVSGSTVMADPSVSSRASGMLDVFYKGSTGSLKHRSYSSGAWGAEEDLGGGIH